jgi:hypothetical protein
LFIEDSVNVSGNSTFDTGFGTWTITGLPTPSPVPEPTSAGTLLFGVLLVAGWRARLGRVFTFLEVH